MVECRVGSEQIPVTALLDTGAEWCVFDGSLVRGLLGAGDHGGEWATLLTRFGRIHGLRPLATDDPQHPLLDRLLAGEFRK
jgi:hypothetical protein